MTDTVEQLRAQLAEVIMKQDDEFQSLKKFAAVYADMTDRLQALCEKHGCIAGSDRVDWLGEMLSAAAHMEEALRMVRDADDDCHRDGLQTIPPMPRSKIDLALAGYTRDRIIPENTPERIFPGAPGSLPMLLSDMGATLQGDQNVKPDATNGESIK